MSVDYKDVEFDLERIVIRGRRWGNESGKPVFALHGWLDNCASFNFLAPHLTGLDIVSLDLAGHGKSDRRGSLGSYNIWQDIAEILAIADELGWEKFGLIGHSRGAMIATMLTSTFPSRVSHLGLIESVLPHSVETRESPDQLAEAVKSVLKLRNRPINYYSTFDNAVKAREEGYIPLGMEDAKVLAERGVISNVKGYYWISDPLLLAPSEVKLTKEQVLVFTDRIVMPVKLIIGDNGMLRDNEYTQNWLASRQNFDVHVLPGHHHLHMSQQHNAIANIFNRYFAENT